MSGELESLLKLVADGKLTAEEAAPIVAALEDAARWEARDSKTGSSSWAGFGGPGAGPDGRRTSVRDALSGRRIIVFVAEDGRAVVNLAIPLAAAGFAIDQVPGLSPDHRSRIVEAIQNGVRGPILEVTDHGDEVRIVIE